MTPPTTIIASPRVFLALLNAELLVLDANSVPMGREIEDGLRVCELIAGETIDFPNDEPGFDELYKQWSER